MYEEDEKYYRPNISSKAEEARLRLSKVGADAWPPASWGGNRVDALRLLSDRIEIHEILEFDIQTKCAPVEIDIEQD